MLSFVCVNPPPAVGKVRSCGGAFLFVCQAAAAEEGRSDTGVQRTARRCVGQETFTASWYVGVLRSRLLTDSSKGLKDFEVNTLV